MKMQISIKEVNDLTGKFIIQLDSNSPDVTLYDGNWGFYKEKRISFVCGLQFVGFYYMHMGFETPEDLVLYFNDYLTTKVKPEDIEEGKGKRFHRLLTSKEIDFVCEKLKSENY